MAASIFVDARLPAGGKSRLDAMAAIDPDLVAALRPHLAAGGHFPTWNDDDLRADIPDDRLRQGVLAELRPRPLAYFTEPLPAVRGWPTAPCGFLRFSPPYKAAADHARRHGWASRELRAGHFHMLVDPVAVTTALVEFVAAGGERSAPG